MALINHFEGEGPNIYERFELIADFLVTFMGKFLVNGGEINENDGLDGPGDDTCEKTHLKKSTLNPHMKSENTDKKETRSKPIDDAPDDENFEGGVEKSAKSESLGYTKVKGGERSGHDVFNGLSDETCVKTHLMKSTLDPHMQETL